MIRHATLFRKPPELSSTEARSLRERLYQPHAAQAGVPAFADDDVIVHGNPQRLCDVDNRLGHLDVGLRWRGIAGGMVVDQAAESSYCVETKEYIGVID